MMHGEGKSEGKSILTNKVIIWGIIVMDTYKILSFSIMKVWGLYQQIPSQMDCSSTTPELNIYVSLKQPLVVVL